jgi:hypothetical protein
VLPQVVPEQCLLELAGSPRQVAKGAHRGLSGVGVPLAELRHDDRLEEARLTLGEVLVHREVAGLNAILEEVLHDGQHDVVVAVVVLGRVGSVRGHQPVGLELLDPLLVDPGRGGHLLDRHLEPGRWLGQLLLDLLLLRGLAIVERLARSRLLGQQPVLDHLEWQVLVALHPQDLLQLVNVLVVELPVPRGRPLRIDQPLGFEEADLRDRDVGELRLHRYQDLADGLVAARGHPPLTPLPGRTPV